MAASQYLYRNVCSNKYLRRTSVAEKSYRKLQCRSSTQAHDSEAWNRIDPHLTQQDNALVKLPVPVPRSVRTILGYP